MKSLIKLLILFAVVALVPHGAKTAHENYMADYIEARTIRLSGEHGSGTGFVIKAPSGMKYVLTNRHVCEVGNLWVHPPKYLKDKRPVRFIKYELSQETDLCIGQAPAHLTKALSLANSGASYRQSVGVTGHPFGQDTPVLTRGVILSKTKVWHPWAMIKDDSDLEQCKLDGGVPTRYMFWNMCFKLISSYLTTVEIYPGNSGSAVVDFWGNVKGVIWGADTYSNRGVAVPWEDVKKFLSVY